MKVSYIHDLKNDTVDNSKRRNITIGFFDAVHLGHQHVINTLIENSNDEIKTVITFDYHPIKRLITPLNEKIEKLKSFDIDEVIVIVMSEQIKSSDRKSFVEFLKKINVHEIFIGPDFRFGQYAKGNVEYLKEYYDVTVVDFIYQDDLKISSSEIRNHLEQGDVAVIKKVLGHNYTIKGAVVHGDQIGRTIGFPTANILTEYFVPKFGVYETKTTVKNKTYHSVTNIGNRPTVSGSKMTIETFLFDFNENIYGEVIELEFIDFIRDEVKFNSLDELRTQIELDKKKVQDNI